MQRLSGQDAYFLYQETPSALMHTLKICVREGSDRPFDYATLREDVARTVALLPVFRRLVLPAPLGLHHPLVVDTAVDVDLHLRRVAVPPPGGQRELEALIGEIAQGRLDRSRPLWEFWIVEGLADGAVAYVNKIHHTLADGLASASYIDKSMFRDPAEASALPATMPPAEPVPSWLSQLGSALAALGRDFARFPGLLARSAKRSREVAARNAGARIVPPRPYSADIPHTRLNHALSPLRAFATARLRLEDFRAIKDALGGTVNDAVLATVAGALREWLLEHGDLPGVPLVAAVPVSIAREAAISRSFGNELAYFHTWLHTELADPVARYTETRLATEAAKEVLALAGEETARDWMEYIPPTLFAWRRRREFRQHAADRRDFPLSANVIVSNVPGPREYRYTAYGERYTALYSAGPLTEGTGLNITVWSYAGQLNFGLIACRRICPDLERLAGLIGQECARLLACANRAPA
jgi:diacylglycerol O-acyltransferase